MNYKKSDYRFSFNDLYGQKYDIDHIYCQTPKDKTGDNRTDWIDTALEYFSGVEKVYADDSKMQKTNDKKFIDDIEHIIPSLNNKINKNITDGYICQQLLEIRDKNIKLNEFINKTRSDVTKQEKEQISLKIEFITFNSTRTINL